MTAAAEQSNAPQFAQVAVPVHLRKLFTYKLPSSMQAATRVGSRVMVQLGSKPTVGYVVALLPKLRTGTSFVESELKEIDKKFSAGYKKWKNQFNSRLPTFLREKAKLEYYTIDQDITTSLRSELESMYPEGGCLIV